jgi:hypothetical protein
MNGRKMCRVLSAWEDVCFETDGGIGGMAAAAAQGTLEETEKDF